MRQVENDITKLIQSEDEYYKLTRPVNAFITFEDEEGYATAC